MGENIQTLQAIHTALSDLSRAGVTDVAGFEAFDFCSSSIEDSKPLVMQISQQTSVSRSESTQKVVQNAVAQLSAQPQKEEPKSEPFALDHHVWQKGENNPVMIVISTPSHHTQPALSPEASSLFEKMLSAIGLSVEEVTLLAVKDEDSRGKPHKAANAKLIAEKVKDLIGSDSCEQILMVGQSCAKILFSESLSALRKQQNSISEKPVVALVHPQMLLKQPALKRMAWQDLLKFQAYVEKGK